MQKYILGSRYRRMAHQQNIKCRIPVYVLATELSNPALKAAWEPFQGTLHEAQSEEGTPLVSVWLEFPFNTQLEIKEESPYEGYQQVMRVYTAQWADWHSLGIYIQPMHLEPRPPRYQIQPTDDGDQFQIMRYNFRYNYYLPLFKLGSFDTEAAAQHVVDTRLKDWAD